MTNLIEHAPYVGATYEWSSPDGDIYVTIVDDDSAYWINAQIGFAGTAHNSDAYAIGVLAGQAIRAGAPKHKIACSLIGITHEKSNGLTQTALSAADAIGKSILKHEEACQPA